MENKELQLYENQGASRLLELSPDKMVHSATALAKPLSDIIEKQKLYSVISGKKHVKCEGWSTLGSMLGILPKEDKIIEKEDGSFEAYVSLIDFKTGRVVAGASSLCGVDEKRWKEADRYARRSMAVTRATGKAYRLAFAWILSLSGYEATPAEEMIDTEAKEIYSESPKQKKYLYDLALSAGVGKDDKEYITKMSCALKGIEMDKIPAAIKEYMEDTHVSK